MNSSIFSAAAALSGALVFTGCDRKTPVPSAPPQAVSVAAEAPAPEGAPNESAAESAALAALAREGRELVAQEKLLQQQIKNETLAAELAALERESAALDLEQAAWLRELSSGAQDGNIAGDGAGTKEKAPCDYQLFYDELEPYGRWFEVPDYGYVWQPTAAYHEGSGWRPCTIGEWVWSDAGWTWISDEPFGWAVYHYGRWAFLRGCGWAWVPGSQWAPAWVAWRRSKKHVGWCPLPPEAVFDCDSEIDNVCGICPEHYVFVPAQHFCEPILPHCEPAHRIKELCQTSVSVTRLIMAGRHGACGGPTYDWVCKHVSRRPQRCTLVCEPGRRRTGPHDSRPRRENDRLCVFTPRVEAPWNRLLRPERLAEAPKAVEVVRNKTGLPEKTVRRFIEHVRVRRATAEQALNRGQGAQIMERQSRVASMREDIQRRHAALPAATEPQPAAVTVPDKTTTAAARREQIESARRALAGKEEALANLRTSRAATASPAGNETPPRIAERGTQAPVRRERGGDLPSPLATPERTPLQVRRDLAAPTPTVVTPDTSRASEVAEVSRKERTSREEAARQLALQQQAQQGQNRREHQQREAAELATQQKTAQQTAIQARQQQETEQQAHSVQQARELAARQLREQQAAMEAERREESERIRKTEEAKAHLAQQREAMATERQRREAASHAKAEQEAQAQAARQREAIAQQQQAAAQRARELEQTRQEALRQREIAETQRREVMERARAEQEAREEAARLQAVREQQQQREAEERARREQHEQQEAARQREIAENQRREAIERARTEHEAHERAKRDAEEQRRHAEENARRAAEEHSRKAAEAAGRAAREEDARKEHDRKK